MAGPGTKVGHYELVTRIAATHTGEVHLARAYGEPYAVKLYKPDFLKPAFFELLEREQATAMTFAHPNAVKILEITEADERPVLATELAWGQSLSNLVRRTNAEGRPLDRTQLQWIGLQVAELLLQAHRTPWTVREVAGLLHGRLTPWNIIITYSGHVKVLGFGVGRSGLTLPLAPAKIAYRAPELFSARIDTRVDVYALGVTLYDSFTGKSLFKRSSNDETREAILANEVPALSREVAGIAREVAGIITKMIAGNPDQRPLVPEIISVMRSGLPDDEDVRLALSERMFTTFANEQKAHLRMRSTAFRDLPPDPFLARAERVAPVLPPKLDASALVELHSLPPDEGPISAAKKKFPQLAEPQDSGDIMFAGIYEAMATVSDPPDPPEDEATIVRPTPTPVPVKPATPTPPRATPAAHRQTGPQLLGAETEESTPSISPRPEPKPAPRSNAGTSQQMSAMSKTGSSQAIPALQRGAPARRRVPGAPASGKPAHAAPTPAATPLGKEINIGDEIAGRYKVLDFLGEGGMARVFKIQHTLLEKDMALKVLRPEVLEMPGVVERFEREARSSCKLDDPNIVRVTDFGRTESGLPYLVMELLTGRSLSALLKDKGRLEAEEACAIIEGVLNGLEHAHSFDIVHRDMKPDNVMLVERGERRTPKIVDFGIAQVMRNDSNPESKLTQVGMVFGTPTYMSPEQATAEPMDLRTDLYAVGIILYEALSGAPPFRAESTVKLLTKVITQPPPPLVAPQVADTMLARIEKVIGKALEKSKEDRYATAAEFRAALRQAVGRTR